jgi:putative oxidoreductase
MKAKLVIGARVLLGLIFFVFGLNFFLHFIPQPPPSGPAGAFAGALFATGYFFVVLKVIEIVSGALLLAGRFVPLVLAVLAPIVINILLFHGFLAPAGVPLAIVVLALELFLAWSYRSVYRPMLAARATPDTR